MLSTRYIIFKDSFIFHGLYLSSIVLSITIFHSLCFSFPLLSPICFSKQSDLCTIHLFF